MFEGTIKDIQIPNFNGVEIRKVKKIIKDAFPNEFAKDEVPDIMRGNDVSIITARRE